MILSLALPILFSSALYTALPYTPEIVETQYVHKESPKDPTVIDSVPNDVLGINCVAYVRSVRPDAPNINASEYPISTTTPLVGAIGKQYFQRHNVWHVFIVLEVRGEMLLIRDGHYDNGYVTTRLIRKDTVSGYL